MPPFRYPDDEETSRKALQYFSEYANNPSYQRIFQDAVSILYGSSYEVKFDLNRRMSFYCCICSKTMNSSQALVAHNNSANHLKQISNRNTCGKYGEYISPQSSSFRDIASRYPEDSLQHRIAKSSVPVIGIHLVEAYQSKGLLYYKCLLCGAHGKKEAMLKHVIGDKHTDKYIRYSIEDDSCLYAASERNHLRTKLALRDGVSVDRIITIKDPTLFPHKWCDEGLNSEAFISKMRNHPDTRPSTSRDHFDVKRERDYSPVRRFSVAPSNKATKKEKPSAPAVLQTKLGVQIHRDVGVSKTDQEVQVYTPWAIERCLIKLNFINHTSHIRHSDVRTREDEITCAQMMHVLCLVLRSTFKPAIQKHKSSSRYKESDERAIENLYTNMNKLHGTVVKLFARHCDDKKAPTEPKCLTEIDEFMSHV